MYRVQPQVDSITRASMALAAKRGDANCGVEHVLLVVLEGDPESPSGRACGAAGDLLAAVQQRLASMSEHESDGTTSNPRHHGVCGVARGLALAYDEPLTEVHALLALVHDGLIGELVGADGVERLLASLRGSGVAVPSAEPPTVGPSPTVSTRIYYPSSESKAVVKAIFDRFPPPEIPFWGINHSSWKGGYSWLDADDLMEPGQLVRAACIDPTEVTEIPLADAVKREREATDG